MIVAAAVATAMLNLYEDVQAKVRREFRNYGANIIVVGRDGASLPASALTQVESVLRGRGLASPFALIVGRTHDGQPLVVAGVDFDRVRQLDRWWSVSAWPSGPRQALIGVRATPEIAPQGQPFDLTFRGGSPQEIAGIMSELSQALPVAEVRPVRQIVEGEARVLGKTRSTLLAATALIVLTAALCVLSTLMGWVFDRRRDFAIMKALGASAGLLNGFFAAEAAVLGAGGAVIGFAAGIGIAAWIGRVNFHAAVTPRFSILPMVMAGSIVVTLLAAIVPISSLRRMQPATILRGE
jgi:putative ABC transport system permease protein